MVHASAHLLSMRGSRWGLDMATHIPHPEEVWIRGWGCIYVLPYPRARARNVRNCLPDLGWGAHIPEVVRIGDAYPPDGGTIPGEYRTLNDPFWDTTISARSRLGWHVCSNHGGRCGTYLGTIIGVYIGAIISPNMEA